MHILIIGQGLTGSLLALELLEQGHTIHVIDNHHHSSATKIAAGILNPLTGPRLSLTWPSPSHLQKSLAHYQKLEYILGTLLVIPLTMAKYLNSDIEKEAFLQKKELKEYDLLFKNPIPKDTYHHLITHPSQGFHIPMYRINTQALITKIRDYLIQKKAYTQDQFTHKNLIISTNKVQWKHLKADQIIFCEGYKGEENPLFSHLKFKNSKGEILHFTCEDLPKKILFNQGKWSCPNTTSTHLYGSTAYWDYHSQDPEKASTLQLTQNLKNWLKASYKITQVVAGIRPTMLNRKPVIETHPQFQNAHIINGLGSHGTYLAPHLISDFMSRFPSLDIPQL